MKKPFTKIAALIFLIVAIGHALRLINDTKIMIGDFEVPMLVSIFGIIVPLLLAYMLLKESK